MSQGNSMEAVNDGLVLKPDVKAESPLDFEALHTQG